MPIPLASNPFIRLFLQLPRQLLRLFSFLLLLARPSGEKRLTYIFPLSGLGLSLGLLSMTGNSLLAKPPISAQASKGNEQPKILQGLQFKPLQFDLPRPKVIRLAYNTTLLKLENAELPILQLSLHFPNGLQHEQILRAGIFQATLQLLEKGGTQKLPGAKFSSTLNRLGASVSLHEGRESWIIKLKVLRPYFDQAFRLLRQLLLTPALPANELENIKNSLIVGIQSRNEKPAKIARESLKELLYPGHRLGYRLQEADIKRLKLKDMQNELLQRIRPDNMYITAVGALQGLALEKKYLTPLLQALKQKAQAKKPMPQFSLNAQALRKRNHSYHGKILLITKPAAQAAIRIGAYLPAHNHPDFYALQVANYILGGGSFTSRLVKKVRVEQGLAYYTYSYNSFSAEHGIFRVGSGTRINRAARALQLILQEIAFMNKQVKTEELLLAKDSILNGLIFQFDTTQKIVSSHVRFRLHQMPTNYLQNFPKQIRMISEKDLVKVANYWQPEDLYIVVVGPASLQKELQKIRPVLIKAPEENIFK